MNSPMRFLLRFVFVACLGLLAPGCSAPLTGQPRWVTHPNLDFPSNRYFVGVASGGTCDDAVDLAITRLSQQIEVEVSSMESHRRLVNDVSGISASNSLIYDSQVTLVSNTTLLGVEIDETLPLPSGECVARAVLDIDRSLGLYDEAIARRGASIESSLTQADRADRIWGEFLAVAAALRSAIDHDKLALTRRVIAGRAHRRLPALTLRTGPIAARYEALRERVSISVVPVGDCPPELIDVAQAALLEHDLPVERDHPGSLQLRIGLGMETKQTFDPRWWSARWRLGVTLYDAEHQESIASNAPRGSTAYGLSEAAAEVQARQSAAEQLTRAIDTALNNPGTTSFW